MYSFYLKACKKCRGDILDNEVEEPSCVQCGERVYGYIEPLKKDRIKRKWSSQRIGSDIGLNTLENQTSILNSNKEIVKLLLEGNGVIFVSDFLNISHRKVSRIKEILKDLEIC